jgi:hypothetical protein
VLIFFTCLIFKPIKKKIEEILGPNKDLTNLDTEIKEAEEFLSEDQINIIRSIVTTDETSTISSAKCSSNDKIEAESSKWENLRPTLRSLGLVRETLNVSSSNLNASTEEDSDFDSLSDDEDDDDVESDINDDIEEEEDTHDDENEDHDNDFDLESIQKRRKKYRQKMKLRKKKKLRLLQEKEDALKSKKLDDDIQCITIDSEPIIIEEVTKIIQKVDTITTTEDTKQDLKSISNKLNNQNGKPRSSVSLSKSVEPCGSDLEKKSGKCILIKSLFMLEISLISIIFFLISKLQI